MPVYNSPTKATDLRHSLKVKFLNDPSHNYDAAHKRVILGVQNTYITAFQSLGALGLLLGAFGLIAVQLRSVLERRKEFAVMRAIGFAPARLAKLLMVETLILLGGGLLVGVVCSMVALIPYVWEVGPQLSFVNPILLLLVVLVIGFAAGAIAIRAANKQSVLDGLRAE